ncbi:MAG: hypothetical protein Q8Q05_01680 [bacterium]|nr:hypothetical protein [bacterium]MDZ4343270.1 hypothetical protein [Candidatus Binatia bacterium]
MVSILVPWTISILVFVSIAIGFILYMKKTHSESHINSGLPLLTYFGSIFTAMTVLVGAIGEHPGLWLFLQPGTYVFNKEGKLLEEVKEGQALWRWAPTARGRYIVQAGPFYATTYEMKVQPITSNPKVRDLHYEVGVAIRSGTDAYSRFLATFGDPGLDGDPMSGRPLRLESEKARTFVRSLLYDFNEEHSRDLAEYYNPLDETQQAKFASLVRPYLKDKLTAVGLEIRSIRFSLP